jgi:hypothetical protein
MWVPHGFWGTPFTLQVREREYQPARHVAYSHFLFPLDSQPLVRDLRDWYLSRSWVEAYDLIVRVGAAVGLPPPSILRLDPERAVPDGACRPAVRRSVVVDGETRTEVVESFAAPGPSPRPAAITWTGALRVEQAGSYLLRLAASGRTLTMGGKALALERNAVAEKAPAFAAVRLDVGAYPFTILQAGEDGEPFDVALSRLAFDPTGYATAVPLDLRKHLCLSGDARAPDAPATSPPS